MWEQVHPNMVAQNRLSFAASPLTWQLSSSRCAFLQNSCRGRILSALPAVRRAAFPVMSQQGPSTESTESLDTSVVPQNGVTRDAPIDQSILPKAVTLSEPDSESQNGPSDIARVSGVAAIVSVIALFLQHSWVESHRDLTMELIFVLGYLGITLEEILCYDKTGVAMLMGVAIWTTFTTTSDVSAVNHLLSEQVADISQILFFLIGAMTIVEIIDGHSGFKVVTDFITTNKRRTLLWTIALLTFFTSAILDNLTSTIVVVSLLKKLVKDPRERWLYGAVAVVAANAGGAWTPIGGA